MADRIIVSLGTEKITGITVLDKGRTHYIKDNFDLNSYDYVLDNGTFDINKIIKDVKEKIGLKSKTDVEIVAPYYMSVGEYYESVKVPTGRDSNVSQKEESSLSTIFTGRKVCKIGSSNKHDITEVIRYHDKMIRSFVQEVYKQKIYMSNLVCPNTCAHEIISLLSDEVNTQGVENCRLLVLFGLTKIYYLVMLNNLPVAIRESMYSLYDVYNIVKNINEDIHYSDFLKAINLENVNHMNLSESISMNKEPEKENKEPEKENKEIAEVNKEKVSNSDNTISLFLTKLNTSSFFKKKSKKIENEDSEYIKNIEKNENKKSLKKEDKVLDSTLINGSKEELNDLFGELMEEIQQIIDWVTTTFGVSDAEIYTDNKQFMNYMKSVSFTFKFIDLEEFRGMYNINRDTIDISPVYKLDFRYLYCLGCLINKISKERDYYV